MRRALRKYLINFRYAFRPAKPILTMRLVARYLSILFLRRRPLRYVDFAVGFACNMRCAHCFATALRDDRRKRLTPEDYRGVVRQAMRLGAVNFSFQGGEPLLYPELLDFIKNSYPRRNLISVTTNALLLDRERIATLKKARVDIVTISIDSGIPGEHDRFRGVEGSHAKAMEAVRLALKGGLNVTIGAVVSHENVRSRGLIELVEAAHRLGVVLFLALAAPLGEWASRNDVVLTEEDRAFLYDLVKRYPLLRTDFDANWVYRGCGAVKEIIYITPYGDVLGCPFLHFSFGNVFEESLRDIRDRALKNPYFKRYHPLCLAAEDMDFMRKFGGPFYLRGSDGQTRVRRLGSV